MERSFRRGVFLDWMNRPTRPDSRFQRAHKLNRRSTTFGTALHTYSCMLQVQYRTHHNVRFRCSGKLRRMLMRAKSLADLRSAFDVRARRVLRCDAPAMNTYAVMARHRFEALTMQAR